MYFFVKKFRYFGYYNATVEHIVANVEGPDHVDTPDATIIYHVDDIFACPDDTTLVHISATYSVDVASDVYYILFIKSRTMVLI